MAHGRLPYTRSVTARGTTTGAAATRDAVRIRAMTPRDIRAAAAIERAAYGSRAPRTEFRRELANGLAEYLVAAREAAPPSTVARSEAAPLAGPGRPQGPARGLLRRSLPRLRRGWPPWGARDGVTDGRALVGFAGVWFTRDQLHLVTIAVAPGWQRRGVAARLLLRCVELAEEEALGSIALEVRPANAGARALYQRFGLREAGRLRGYYPDSGEDALLMLSPPLDDAAFRERMEGLRAELTHEVGAR